MKKTMIYQALFWAASILITAMMAGENQESEQGIRVHSEDNLGLVVKLENESEQEPALELGTWRFGDFTPPRCLVFSNFVLGSVTSMWTQLLASL